MSHLAEAYLDDSKFNVILNVDHGCGYHFNWNDNLCVTYTEWIPGKEIIFLWDLVTGKKILQSEYEHENLDHNSVWCCRDAVQLDNQKYVAGTFSFHIHFTNLHFILLSKMITPFRWLLSAGVGVRQYDIRTGVVEQKWKTSSPLNICLEYHDNIFVVSLENGIAFYDFR